MTVVSSIPWSGTAETSCTLVLCKKRQLAQRVVNINENVIPILGDNRIERIQPTGIK